jgi:hypothetical protein
VCVRIYISIYIYLCVMDGCPCIACPISFRHARSRHVYIADWCCHGAIHSFAGGPALCRRAGQRRRRPGISAARGHRPNGACACACMRVRVCVSLSRARALSLFLSLVALRCLAAQVLSLVRSPQPCCPAMSPLCPSLRPVHATPRLRSVHGMHPVLECDSRCEHTHTHTHTHTSRHPLFVPYPNVDSAADLNERAGRRRAPDKMV